MPVSEDLGEFSSVQPQVGNVNGDLVNDLGNRLMDVLIIQHEHEATAVTGQCSHSSDVSSRVRHDDCEEPTGMHLENFCSEKSVVRSATFPCSNKGKSLLSAMFDGNMDSVSESTTQDLSPADHVQPDNCPYTRSLSLPTPSKLVSAMKGSREKLGAPPRRLAVTWAPDVYDPIPTSVSHVPSRSSRLRSNNKRNGKNKQKASGKGSRGTKGKEKKKSRKYSGVSSSSFVSLDNSLDINDDEVTCSGRPNTISIGYDVGKPDPFCGHSFLKRTVAPMHFPVAEAT